MNITHAENEVVNGDKLLAIFNRQKELMSKYHDIEKASGLLQTEDCPVNLHDKRGQARIKDFAWRIVEELGEAIDAEYARDIPHYKEELIDGLHFLTELTILTGVPIERLGECDFPFPVSTDMFEALYEKAKYIYRHEEPGELVKIFVKDIGMMCNCLKNKPWKQSQMLTDIKEFTIRLSEVWLSYLSILASVMDDEEIVMTYLKKSQVNKFRQRSNY